MQRLRRTPNVVVKQALVRYSKKRHFLPKLSVPRVNSRLARLSLREVRSVALIVGRCTRSAGGISRRQLERHAYSPLFRPRDNGADDDGAADEDNIGLPDKCG